MKIIEAMKRIKSNKEKIVDLQALINKNCAHLSYETAPYGVNTEHKIKEWIQSCLALSRDNAKLLTSISKTNLATAVTIQLGEHNVTKNIAEWVWRRREYAACDYKTYSSLTDRGLKEGQTPSTTGGEPLKISIVRYFDPAKRDEMLALYKSEAHEIDAALEIVNAVTDLLE